MANIMTDISGNNNTFTMSKVVKTKDGLLFNGVDSVGSCGGSNGLNGDISFSFRINAKTLGGNSAGRIFDSTGCCIFTNASTIGFSRNGASNTITSNSGFGTNNYYNIVITSTAAGVTNFYSNGVLVNTATAVTGNAATNWYLGNNSVLSRGLDGILEDFRIHNRILSATEAKQYHNSFVQPTLVDNLSSEPADGTAYTPTDWIKGTGSYSIQEMTASESYLPKGTKYLRCKTAGTIAIPSNQAYGTWEWDWYKGADGNQILISLNSNNNIDILTRYYFQVYTNERIGINNTLYTTTSYITNNTWYRIKIARTNAGVFTVLIKGGSFVPTVGYDSWTLISTTGGIGSNPVLDQAYSTSNFLVLDLDSGDRFANLLLTNGIKQ